MGTAASYTGPGAGRFPTANSIVADVMRIVDGVQPRNPFSLETEIELEQDYTSAFYIRILFMDSLGIIRKIGGLAEKHGVSIHSILQNPIQIGVKPILSLQWRNAKCHRQKPCVRILTRRDSQEVILSVCHS
jgi:hypothetical protein